MGSVYDQHLFKSFSASFSLHPNNSHSPHCPLLYIYFTLSSRKVSLSLWSEWSNNILPSLRYLDGGRGGTLLNFRWGGPTCDEKMDPMGSKVFCKNEGSKRSNNNEEGGQQDRKSRRKLVQIATKVSNDRFLWKNRPALGQIIFGTKCDRDKPIFSTEREGQ